MWATLAGLLGVAAGGAVTALLSWWLHRGRERAQVATLRAERDQLRAQSQQAHADAAGAITAAATTLLAPLQARVDQLEQLVSKQRGELQQLRPLRGEVDRWRAENARLHAELDGLRAENARLHAQLNGLRADLDERTGQRAGGGSG